jgi:hypothetical protein
MNIATKIQDEVFLDNDLVYFSFLQGVVESVDELCSMEITQINNGFKVRIAPSLPTYNNLLLEEIIKLHNVFNIHIDISKSIKSSGSLDFKIIRQ